MKIAYAIVLAFSCLRYSAQQKLSDTLINREPFTFDTVYIRALNGRPADNIPFSITDLSPVLPIAMGTKTGGTSMLLCNSAPMAARIKFPHSSQPLLVTP